MRKIHVPYFDNAEVELDDQAEIGDVPADDDAGSATLQAFLRLSEPDRLNDTRHVYAYYRDFHEAVGGEEFLDAEMGVPQTPEAIWAHVTPRQIYLVRGDTAGGQGEGHCYLVVLCDCDWEIEHGLAMVWRDGTLLNKVGGDDGHVTNEHAYADPDLSDVVYRGIDRAFRTRLSS